MTNFGKKIEFRAGSRRTCYVKPLELDEANKLRGYSWNISSVDAMLNYAQDDVLFVLIVL